MIEVDQLNMSFRSHDGSEHIQVLSDINARFEGGEITSIIGPSGSGKTTLLRCLIGLESFDSGNIMYEGRERADYSEMFPIAYVSQSYSNFPWLNVIENIRIARPRISEQESHKWLKAVELDGFEHHYIKQLSGGMQQRLAIARALAQNTEIILMDEPFGALDFRTRESLQILLKDLKQKFNKTIVFVTHDIEEAIFISDSILALSINPSTIIYRYDSADGLGSFHDPSAKYGTEMVVLRQRIEQEVFWEPNKAFREFLAGRFEEINEQEISYHNNLNSLRGLVQGHDPIACCNRISEMLSSDREKLHRLGALLYRNLVGNDEINQLLWERFESAEDYPTQFMLLHEVTNRFSDENSREKCFAFIKSDLERYLNTERNYFTQGAKNNRDKVQSDILYRLKKEPKASKNWVLLISLMAACSRMEAASIARNYYGKVDEFTDQVIGFIQKQSSEIEH